ncbi:hypothetical protein EV121DRAFT_298234 [Schizophyllum commune]
MHSTTPNRAGRPSCATRNRRGGGAPSLDLSTLIALDGADITHDATIPAHLIPGTVDSSSLPNEPISPRHLSSKRTHSSENDISDSANKRQKVENTAVQYKVINPLMNVTLVDAGNVVLPVSQSDASAIPPAPASKGGDATAGNSHCP